MKTLRFAEADRFGVNLWAPNQDRLLGIISYETPGEALIRRTQVRQERVKGLNRAWREERRRKGFV